MVTRININGIDGFDKFEKEADPNGPPIFFLFSGEKLPSGHSWCIDCNNAEPVIEAFLTEVKKNIVFVTVDVGNREYWKSRDCPFRTDNRTKLMVIPTIIKWKGVQRLEGEQCGKRELLQMLVEDEED